MPTNFENLSRESINFLIDCLKTGKEIPDTYRYALFPTKQKEYELVYEGKARKEDVLADKEEAKPVPLQIEKIFNGNRYPPFQKDWHNLLVFGDNLQVLKTFYENKDPLIKGKVKEKVKLIYIDPPFATSDEFQGNEGAKAYSDKKKGAEFVEFLRRRLIVAREILSDDGVIYVHLDQKMDHYIKVLMDEIFGKENFRNEIVWHYRRWTAPSGTYQKMHDNLLFYSKSSEFALNLVEVDPTEGQKAKRQRGYDRNSVLIDGRRQPQLLIYDKDKVNKVVAEGKIKLSDYARIVEIKNKGTIAPDVWEINFINSQAQERLGYPTQKPEELLKRIIMSSTNIGDIVMDFFCGSGTTLAVAEKLGRRWIGCDVGKLALYTVQKRLLDINESRDLNNPKKEYAKPAKSFSVITAGLYDLGKIFELAKDIYIRFVKDLFEIEESKQSKIGGIDIDGMKRGFPVKIFPYWEMKKTSVDEKYLEVLHKGLGRKVGERFYIIAPANNVDFISDYHKIDDTRYYFLKVPYQIIKELHNVPFKKMHQPQSKSQVNDLEEAIGFSFVRPPEVESKIKIGKDKIILTIKKFETAYTHDDSGEKLKNFESLAMLLVDLNYDGDKFMMTHCYFADELLHDKLKTDNEEGAEEIKKELKARKEIMREFSRKECGKQMMAIYVDIYGNEFKEVFKLK
jgi:site-specific DNA-methyltransferase (adenine-specific)/adenine-specific DNA-methyltransferase